MPEESPSKPPKKNFKKKVSNIGSNKVIWRLLPTSRYNVRSISMHCTSSAHAFHKSQINLDVYNHKKRVYQMEMQS